MVDVHGRFAQVRWSIRRTSRKPSLPLQSTRSRQRCSSFPLRKFRRQTLVQTIPIKDELPPCTDTSRPTPTPTPSQSSASPSERLTAQTSAPTMPSQMPASSTTPSSAAYLQAAKPLTKAQRKKARIRACLKGNPCMPLPSQDLLSWRLQH